MRLFVCTLLVAFVATAADATPTKPSVADQIPSGPAGRLRQLPDHLPIQPVDSPDRLPTALLLTRTDHTPSQSEAVGPIPWSSPWGRVLFCGAHPSVHQPCQAEPRMMLQKFSRLNAGSLSARTSALTVPKVVAGRCSTPS